MKLKLGKGILKAVGKAAKEAGEEVAEQGVKSIVKSSPRHIKKMAHMAADSAGNVTKRQIKTLSINPSAWKETAKKIGKGVKEVGEETTKSTKKTMREAYQEFLNSRKEKRRNEILERYKDELNNPNSDPSLIKQIHDHARSTADKERVDSVDEKFKFFKSLGEDRKKVVSIGEQQFSLGNFKDPEFNPDSKTWKSGASFQPMNIDKDGNAKIFDLDDWTNVSTDDAEEAVKMYEAKLDEMINNPNITVEDMDYDLKKQKINQTKQHMRENNNGNHYYSADEMDKKINPKRKRRQGTRRQAQQTHPESVETPINIDTSIGGIESQLYNTTKTMNNPNPNFEYTKGKNFDIELSKHNHQTSSESIFNSQIEVIQDLYDNGQIDDDKYQELIQQIQSNYTPRTEEQEQQLVNEFVDARMDELDDINKTKNQTGIDMDQFKTAEEMNQEAGNNFNANDFSENTQNTPIDFDTDDEAYSFIEREDFKYRRTKGNIDRIQDKKTGDTYRIVRSDDDPNNIVGIFDADGKRIEKELEDQFIADSFNERLDYLSGFGDREWDQAYNDAYNYGFTSQAEVLDSRKAQVADDLADVERRLENMKKAKGKSAKKQREALEKQKAKLQSKQAGLEYREGRLKDEAFKQQKISEAQDIFDKTVENLDPADAGYDAAYKEAEEAFKQAEKAWTDKTDAARELAKETTQGKIAAFKDTTSTMGKVMKAWGTINTAKSAVDKYKESRAEGRGVISSGVRAAGSAVAADMLGPIGSIALPFIQAAPGAVIGATDFIMSEQRRMNSSANFMPLGGTSFQDSQQLATMRQSGMELAKMSQYNLEQTLMGAEAKHLHR
jgi:hypothetical protein